MLTWKHKTPGDGELAFADDKGENDYDIKIVRFTSESGETQNVLGEMGPKNNGYDKGNTFEGATASVYKKDRDNGVLCARIGDVMYTFDRSTEIFFELAYTVLPQQTPKDEQPTTGARTPSICFQCNLAISLNIYKGISTVQIQFLSPTGHLLKYKLPSFPVSRRGLSEEHYKNIIDSINQSGTTYVGSLLTSDPLNKDEIALISLEGMSRTLFDLIVADLRAKKLL